MATVRWLGRAKATTHKVTITVGGVLVGDTFTISVGGKVIVSFTDSTGVIETAVDAMISQWNASTSGFATPITATKSGTTMIVLTADEAGFPFAVTLTVSVGAATFTQATTVTATGPNFFDNADNWSGGVAPASTDNIIFENNNINCCWNISQPAIEAANIYIMASFTGLIGLRADRVATTADGATNSTTEPEYRSTYLEFDHYDRLEIGEKVGPGTVAGSRRIKIDNNNTDTLDDPSIIVVHSTASSSIEGAGVPAVRLLAADNGVDIYINSALGGVGIAVDQRNETSTVGNIRVADPSTSSRVYVGSGVTFTSFEQLGGTNEVASANTPTTVSCFAGVLNLKGVSAITTLDINGGIVNDGRKANITTVNIDNGTLDATVNQEAKTYTNVNLGPGANLVLDQYLTVTNWWNTAIDKKLSLSVA